MIVSKRHPWKFYASLLYLFLFIGGLSAVYFTAAVLSDKESPAMKVVLPILGIGQLIFLFYFIRNYFKNAPIIRLDETTISFGEKESCQLSQIERIDFTGKISFSYFLGLSIDKEGATITFKDGTKKYIFDDMYENTWQIKEFLEKKVIQKEEQIIPELNKNISFSLKREDIEIFKDNQLKSQAGILIWGFLAFIVGLLIWNGKVPETIGILMMGGIWVFLFTLFSTFMCYFGVSQNYLVVKNHNFFWLGRVYRLENIKEVVREEHGYPNRMPYTYALRVTTNNFKSEVYRAGTLKTKTWGKLMSRLVKKGIKVKYERI